MLPVLAAAAISAAPGLINSGIKLLAGNKQIKKGEKIDRLNKFIPYQRPSEVNQALKLSENNYLNGMPGADILKNRIGTNAATALNTAREGASSSADVLDAATRIGNSANVADQNLSMQQAEYKNNALAGYENQLGNSANYADKEFSYNVAQPYERKAAAASALIGAGNTNKYNGIDEGLGIMQDSLHSVLAPKPPTIGQIFGNPNMGEITGNHQMPQTGGITGAGITPSTGFKFPNIISNTANPMSASAGVPKLSFANPALLGKWIVDQGTGARRWVAN